MSDPGSRNDPRGDEFGAGGLHETAQQALASVALGERIDLTLEEHVRGCALCRRDIDAYRQVADLARSSKRAVDVPVGPPPRVWDRIAEELGRTDSPSVPLAVVRSVPTFDDVADGNAPVGGVVRPSRWRSALLAAAAVVVLAGTGIAGWAIGHQSSPTSGGRSSQALLAAQPGTSTAAQGKAIVHSTDTGYTLSVDADGLPVPEGYYEVWLFNPSINQMVAVGTLGAGGQGSFTVPDGIDLSAYHVVDVSAQKYDGNNTHERSVLRGPLSR